MYQVAQTTTNDLPRLDSPAGVSRWARVRSALADAAVAGLVLGVKWFIAILFAGFALAAWVGDYQVTRTRAQSGQAAYDYIIRVNQQQAAKTSQAPVGK